jgi:serine phosphatase RsbU (regulator of sigma subunit)
MGIFVTDVAPKNIKFFRTTQWVYLVGLFGHTGAFVAFSALGFTEIALFNGIVSIPAFLVAFISNRRGLHNMAFAFAFFELIVHQILAVHYLGWESGAQFWFVYLAGLSFFNASWSYKTQIVLLSLTLLSFACSYIFNNYTGVYHIPSNFLLSVYITNALSAIGILAFLINNYARSAQQAEERLEKVIVELSDKNEEIAHQQENILESINYAKLIQTAVIPDSQGLEKHFAQHFVLFEPTSIVSGDFYWYSETQDQIIVICADCTGHGVPGGFMSMLGMSFLGELVNNQQMTNPAQILDELRKKVKSALRNNEDSSQPKDGMDMSVCVFDKAQTQLRFAGANNGIFVMRGKEITEYKPTKNPIGVYPKEIPFTQIDIALQPNDRVYLYTDGYIDQFGGNDDKKFMKRQLKEKLVNLHNLSLTQQGQQLHEVFKNWRGTRHQIDDCTLMGLHIGHL